MERRYPLRSNPCSNGYEFQANSITVPGQFFGHAKAEDRLFHGVVQDVKSDQPRVKVPIIELRAAGMFSHKNARSKTRRLVIATIIIH